MDITCPHGHRVEISPSQVGTEVHCPTCGMAFTASGAISGSPSSGPSAAGATGSTPASGSAAASATSTGHRNPTSADVRTGDATRYQPTTSGDYWADRWNLDILERLRPFGQILLFSGLVLALMARGWDSVAQRHADGVSARIQHAMSEFEDEWEDRFTRLDNEENAIRGSRNMTTEDRERQAEIADERRELEQDRRSVERRERARWEDMQRSARETVAENQLARPWREGLFVFGTILFSLGLLGIGFTTEGPIRWFCLVLLVVVLLYMFFGSDFSGTSHVTSGRS